MKLTTTSNNIEYFLERGIKAKDVNLEELLPPRKRNQITLSTFVLYRRRRVYLEDIFKDYHNVTKKLKKYPRLILCNTRPVIDDFLHFGFLLS